MSLGTDGALGPSTWAATPVYQGNLLVDDGYPLDPAETLVLLMPGGGAFVPTLAGGAFHHVALAHQHAPEDLSGLGITITITASTSNDFYKLRELAGRAFDVFIESPIEDIWKLRPDGRTVFSLSRWTAGALVDTTQATGPYAPSARIIDFPVEVALTTTTLTVIESGSPAAGEILIDAAARTATVTTADLSGETLPRALVVKLWPVRRYRIVDFQRDAEPPSHLVYTLTLQELVPVVDYDAVVQP